MEGMVFNHKAAFSYRGDQPMLAEVVPGEGYGYRDGLVQILNAHGHHGRPMTGCEIGVDKGDTTKRLLDAFPNLRLYGIDPWRRGQQMKRRHRREWAQRDYEVALKNLQPYGGRVTLIREDSHTGSPQVPNDLDFIFIDGDHSYNGVRIDSKTSSVKLKDSGLLIGHDYGDKAFWEVTMWVNWLIQCAKWPIKTIEGTGLWYIQKTDIPQW